MDSKIIKTIFKRHQVALAYLFGSQARGHATAHSDIDIAILFSPTVKVSRYRYHEQMLRDELHQALHSDQIDLVNLNTNYQPLLRHNAVFSGRLVYAANQLDRFHFEHQVQRDFEDTISLRNTQFRLLKRRLQTKMFGRIQPTSVYLQKLLK
ncbi:MAG: nucleotidyltransferase domain-containing protein [Candidatus Kerfeldbacteria bacterium]|nr:nucleotidyltransferase domain-containing protein [Candidatus Kerfeldbacteria bacterium]